MGSFELHEKIVSHIIKGVNLEDLLGFEPFVIKRNLIVNPYSKDMFEIDIYLRDFHFLRESIIEVKCNSQLRSKFNKQLRRFESYFPLADVYFAYLKDEKDLSSLSFELFPKKSENLIFEYY